MKKTMLLIPLLALAACAQAPVRYAGLAAAVADFAGQPVPDYEHALIDLNGDGTDDAIVLLQGMEWCGSGGCTMAVLRGDGDDFTVLSTSTVTRAPIRVLDSVNDSWRDLIVHSDGAEKLLSFDGRGYPSNPSMQPTATPEQVEAATVVIR